MASSKLPVPGPNASEFSLLQYEHAILHEAYKLRGEQIEELEALCSRYLIAFGKIDTSMQEVVRNQ
jgi:hypothetical protein